LSLAGLPAEQTASIILSLLFLLEFELQPMSVHILTHSWSYRTEIGADLPADRTYNFWFLLHVHEHFHNSCSSKANNYCRLQTNKICTTMDHAIFRLHCSTMYHTQIWPIVTDWVA